MGRVFSNVQGHGVTFDCRHCYFGSFDVCLYVFHASTIGLIDGAVNSRMRDKLGGYPL